MKTLLNLIFWVSLALLFCYIAVALSAGATALFQRDWRTAFIPVVAIAIFMASGYAKGIVDLVKRQA